MTRPEDEAPCSRTALIGKLDQLIAQAAGEHLRALVIVQLAELTLLDAHVGPSTVADMTQRLHARIGSMLRSNDRLFRDGPHRLVILTGPLLNPGHAELLRHRLTDACREEARESRRLSAVDWQLGLATTAVEAATADALFRAASLDLAHQQGLDLERFAPVSEQSEDSNAFLDLASELQRALDEDQLTLHFQPKLSLHDHRTIGAEALLRWQHPHLGAIPPDHFIPLAERTGLIAQINQRVFNLALRHRREAPEAFPGTLAINLSPAHLDRDLVTALTDAIRLWDAEPDRILLEITETAVVRDLSRLAEQLRPLRTLGVQISIDDFGTGYASLDYLRWLEAAELKIDRGFVSGLLQQPFDHELVQHAIDLGHSLGMQVTAEGVEDAETLDTLARLGCDAAQGWHIGRPMPLEDWVRWTPAQRKGK